MKRLRSSGTVSAIDPSGSVNALQQITDMLRGVQADVSQIIVDYNKEVYTTIGTLPQGKAETRWRLSTDAINPRVNNLDGANVFVDTDASSTSDGGRFWLSNATTNRPKTVKESLLDLYTTLTAAIDQLRAEIAALGQGNPVAVYNTSLTAGNLIEDDVRSIVFDGSTIAATSAGTNAIRVVSSGGAGGSGDVTGPRIVVGNSTHGDTSDECDYLDAGNGVNLSAAISAAGVLSPPADVWVRPGLYDFGASGGPSTRITIPVGVKVRGAGRQAVTVRGNTSAEMTVFRLSDEAELQDMTVEIPRPTAAGTGNGGVELEGDRCECARVLVEFNNAASYDATDASELSLKGAFYVGTGDIRVRLTDCGVGLEAAAPALSQFGAYSLAGVYIDLTTSGVAADVTRCRVVGTDKAYYTARTARFNNCEVEDAYDKGFHVDTATAQYSQVTNSWIEMVADQSAEVGIHIDTCNRCDVSNNYIVATTGSAGVRAIYIESADYSIVQGNRGTGWNVPIELSSGADNNTVIGNRVGAVTDGGSTNDVAHNA